MRARTRGRRLCASCARRPTSRRYERLGEIADWLNYDIPPEIAGHAWSGKYRGQTQKWFALRFTGDESEIDIVHPAGGHEPEFVEWRWEKLQNLPALVVPFKREVYERVVARICCRRRRRSAGVYDWIFFVPDISCAVSVLKACAKDSRPRSRTTEPN